MRERACWRVAISASMRAIKPVMRSSLPHTMDSMAPKVAIENAILRGSPHAENMQKVATLYVDEKEYRIYAPARAQGNALEWTEHFVVRTQSSGDFSFGAEIAVDDELKPVLIQVSVDELKRHALNSEIWGTGGRLEGNFYPAQICLHGHVITADGHHLIGADGRVGIRKGEHCQKCGNRCVTHCESCEAPIRGKRTMSHEDFVRPSFVPPSFCYNCAKPYPWMEDRLQTARELLWNDDKLSLEERESLWGLLQYVMSDPKSDLVPAKRKLIDIKLGRAVAATREFVENIIAKSIAETLRPG